MIAHTAIPTEALASDEAGLTADLAERLP